jgi:hypothetical protein
MKNALYQFIIGLAYAFEHTSSITPRISQETKVFLFPLGQRGMFSNLMRCADQAGLPEGEIHRFLRNYILEPGIHEKMNWFSIDHAFEIVGEDIYNGQGVLIDTIFMRSVLVKKIKSEACVFYEKNKQVFDFLVKVLIQEDVRHRYQFDLVFITKDQ